MHDLKQNVYLYICVCVLNAIFFAEGLAIAHRAHLYQRPLLPPTPNTLPSGCIAHRNFRASPRRWHCRQLSAGFLPRVATTCFIMHYLYCECTMSAQQPLGEGGKGAPRALFYAVSHANKFIRVALCSPVGRLFYIRVNYVCAYVHTIRQVLVKGYIKWEKLNLGFTRMCLSSTFDTL